MPHKTIWTGVSLVAEGDGFWCDKNKSQGHSLSPFKSIRILQREIYGIGFILRRFTG